jgi:hypothetical protein
VVLAQLAAQPDIEGAAIRRVGLIVAGRPGDIDRCEVEPLVGRVGARTVETQQTRCLAPDSGDEEDLVVLHEHRSDSLDAWEHDDRAEHQEQGVLHQRIASRLDKQLSWAARRWCVDGRHGVPQSAGRSCGGGLNCPTAISDQSPPM